jgi:glyoxylase-like metal-dependent hydrolase (beta-lactamase superfamily II)
VSASAPTVSPKPPQQIFPNLWIFAPNRETLGGVAYLIQHPEGNVLVDLPAWNPVNAEFLKAAQVQHCFLTHRGAIAQASPWRSALDCSLWIQEQETYLLPGLQPRSFQTEITLAAGVSGFWTPGHSPGSACLYWQEHGGILFSGRHLLPNAEGNPTPLHTRKTFHWPRQVRQVQALVQRFSVDTLTYICPGASLGLLRGAKTIDRAYDRLCELNFEILSSLDPDL